MGLSWRSAKSGRGKKGWGKEEESPQGLLNDQEGGEQTIEGRVIESLRNQLVKSGKEFRLRGGGEPNLSWRNADRMESI